MGRRWLPPLLSVLVLLPMLDAPLLVDERVQFFEARKWIGLDPLAPWQLPLGGSGTWRPLTTWLFWLDAGAPRIVQHGAQILAQAGLAAAVHRWLEARLSGPAALFGACVFALHPAHVATGGWIGGRPDLAMALCATVALVAADRRRTLAAAALAAGAVLCKETAVVLPVLAWIAGARRREVGAMAVAAGLLFVTAWIQADVADSYRPGTGGLAIAALWGPVYGLEVLAPLFHPLALWGPSFALGVLAAGLLVRYRPPSWRPALFVGAALLPVAHVLPNDGGQWYLLLPSLGAAWWWGSVGRPRLLLPVLAVASLVTALQWREASQAVDAVLRSAESPADAPPAQDPRDWPHHGPSFCCGLPFQVFEPPPGSP